MSASSCCLVCALAPGLLAVATVGEKFQFLFLPHKLPLVKTGTPVRGTMWAGDVALGIERLPHLTQPG